MNLKFKVSVIIFNVILLAIQSAISIACTDAKIIAKDGSVVTA